MSLVLNNLLNVFNNSNEKKIELTKEEELTISNKIESLNTDIIEENDKLLIPSSLMNLNRHFLKKVFPEGGEFDDVLITEVSYIVCISFLKKNTTIHVSNPEGRLITFCTASLSLKFSGNRRVSQPKTLIKLLDYFLCKTTFTAEQINSPVALHLKHVDRRHLKYILITLKTKFNNIVAIYYDNFYPYNGCRLKKIRRVKRRTKKKPISNKIRIFS